MLAPSVPKHTRRINQWVHRQTRRHWFTEGIKATTIEAINRINRWGHDTRSGNIANYYSVWVLRGREIGDEGTWISQ